MCTYLSPNPLLSLTCHQLIIEPKWRLIFFFGFRTVFLQCKHNMNSCTTDSHFQLWYLESIRTYTWFQFFFISFKCVISNQSYISDNERVLHKDWLLLKILISSFPSNQQVELYNQKKGHSKMHVATSVAQFL